MLALVGMIALPLQTLAQPKDVEGWNKARWGMTEEQILSTFEGQVERFTKTETYQEVYVNLWIRNLDIGGEQYEVRFHMDKKTNQLVKVVIKPKDKKGSIVLFKSLEQMLMEKYGPPSYKDDSYNPEKFTCAWNFPTTTIELLYIELLYIDLKIAGAEPLFGLIYRPNKKHENL
jgi:hypothetical protein